MMRMMATSTLSHVQSIVLLNVKRENDIMYPWSVGQYALYECIVYY